MFITDSVNSKSQPSQLQTNRITQNDHQSVLSPARVPNSSCSCHSQYSRSRYWKKTRRYHQRIFLFNLDDNQWSCVFNLPPDSPNSQRKPILLSVPPYCLLAVDSTYRFFTGQRNPHQNCQNDVWWTQSYSVLCRVRNPIQRCSIRSRKLTNSRNSLR